MPEEVEVDTQELRETLEELHEERRERVESEKRSSWTRYVALTTAVLAVFAALGALRSGALVNEAMIAQLKASDKWNEYQADRQKEHLYLLQANALVDAGARLRPQDAAAPADKPRGAAPSWRPADRDQRLAQYTGEVQREAGKEKGLKEEAEALEAESERQMHQHHQLAQSVALIQVAIAVSAVAVMTRMRWIWVLSLLSGSAGLLLFVLGAVSR
ncbi:MAG TPA: DUF4337 family protein [Armatimonadota bacterium]|jgi:hypothetical protein